MYRLSLCLECLTSRLEDLFCEKEEVSEHDANSVAVVHDSLVEKIVVGQTVKTRIKEPPFLGIRLVKVLKLRSFDRTSCLNIR